MQKNDCIQFENFEFDFGRSFQVKITSIHHYGSFSEFLMKETLLKCLPGIDTVEQGVRIYHKYYKKEDEAKYQIVAIRFRVL